MIRFEHGRSYIWLLAIIAALFYGGVALLAIAGKPQFGVLALPVVAVFLLLCQLRSGIALDSWWRASHLRESWEYQVSLVWQGAAVVFFSVLAYFCIQQ